NHSVKVCPKRANARDPKNLQLEKLYTKFRPAQHKKRAKQHSPEDNSRSHHSDQQKQPKSYADVVNSRKPNDNIRRPWNRQNIRQTHNHNDESRYHALYTQIHEPMKVIEDIFDNSKTHEN